MQSKASRMRAIVKADNARRAARIIAEDCQLGLDIIEAVCAAPQGVDPYHWSRSITGIPSAGNRDYKASVNCWDRGMRGKTFGTAGDDQQANTMLVTHAGISTVVPISSVRNKRDTRAAIRVARSTTPEVASLPSIRAGESY